jgi:hypothetical protein
MSEFQTNTVAITDYRIKSPTLAKVILSYTGKFGREFLHEEVSRIFDGQAALVKASVKKIQEGVAVGFVKANRAVRVVSPKELKAYVMMGSNMLMDDKDKSLWEVKQGTGGNKFLAKHGQEDLTALVQASRFSRPDVPKLSHLTIARAGRNELVSFVDDEGDVDHGFTLATSDSQVKVLSFQRRAPLTVDYDSVVGIQPIQVDAGLHAAVMATLSPEEKKQANAYWTRLYSYDPEYMRETIKQVNEGTMG